MNPTQFFDPTSHSYTYILFDEVSRDALIVDPVAEQLDRDLGTLQRLNLRLRWVVQTQAGAASAAKLAESTGAQWAAPEGSGAGTDPAPRPLKDGEVLRFGREAVQVLHMRGQAANRVCFYWERKTLSDDEVPPELVNVPLGHEMRPDLRQDERHVFTGDTLLIGGCGPADSRSGAAGQLYDSITQRLFTLPDDTIVWPGQDDQEHTQSTIALEKSTNPYLADKSRDEFVALMTGPSAPQPNPSKPTAPAPQEPSAAGSPSEAPQPATGYAGDITPQLAQQWMVSGDAVLVDVRTDAEREWVGFVPGAAVAAWKQWPGMALNPDFDAQVRAAAEGGLKVMLLCRSGGRSIAAAKRATELGLTAYNVLGGFEGDLDANAQRGQLGGWRKAGLPWRQN